MKSPGFKQYVTLTGILFGLGFTGVTYWIFLTAWFHGGITTVAINIYHEAVIELIAIPLVFIWILVAFILYVRKGIK